MADQETRYIQAEGVQVHETDDGLVAFDPDTDRVHHLNFTAGVIFTLCEQGTTRSALIARLGELYDLKDVPGADVDQALEQLVKEGLLAASGA